MVTDDGEKQRQLFPTVTVTVVALTDFGNKAKSVTMAATATITRNEEGFAAAAT